MPIELFQTRPGAPRNDALGRRIQIKAHTDADGSFENTHRFYWDNQQMIERTDGNNSVQQAYVWGNYIDELLLYEDVAGTGSSSSAGDEFYALRHHNYNVVALMDDTGSVVERYDYNPYGKRLVLDTSYNEKSGGTDYALRIGHQGLYHDAVTGLVYNRARMLHTQLGRFTSRDPLGYVDGMSVYAAYHLMTGMLDPRGLAKCERVVERGGSAAKRGEGFQWLTEWRLKTIGVTDVDPVSGLELSTKAAKAGAFAGAVTRYVAVYVRQYAEMFKCCDNPWEACDAEYFWRGPLTAEYRVIENIGRAGGAGDDEWRLFSGEIMEAEVKAKITKKQKIKIGGEIFGVHQGFKSGLINDAREFAALPDPVPRGNIDWDDPASALPKGDSLVDRVKCDPDGDEGSQNAQNRPPSPNRIPSPNVQVWDI